MTVVVAPDKFKGSLGAAEAAAALAAGVRLACGGDVMELPLADGGDGTLDVVFRTGAREVKARARDPLGRPVEARIALLEDGRAVIESAEVGLRCVAPEELDPLRASSAGVGDLIAAATELGANEILVGVGGSAWTDGGTGMATALGGRFDAADGSALPPGGGALSALASAEPPGRLSLPVVALCDVDHVLVGTRGAARVFAPQKGASLEEVEQLEASLAALARVAPAVASLPGAGAGGGLAFGIAAFLGGRIVPGFDEVATIAGLDGALSRASLVVTGEGRLDRSSLAGKTPVGVARRARRAGVPCVVVAGQIALSDSELRGAGFDDWASVARPDDSSDAAALESAAAALLKRRMEAGGSGDTGRT